MCSLLTTAGLAQLTTRATLETSETLFTVLAATQTCVPGEDSDASQPLRAAVAQDVAQAGKGSAAAAKAQAQLCQFYRDHRLADPGRNLSQYISLALNLTGPPSFAPAIKEADLPPDAAYVLGVVPLLERFYQDAGMAAVWQKYKPQYDHMVEGLHAPVAQMLLEADVYLKLQFSGYLGRKFAIVVEPLLPSGQVNARNYASDYYVLLSPSGGTLRSEPIRHTYLHYVLDPLAYKRANALRRLEPLLATVRTAPMDDSFKFDILLLTTESLIRAIEARNLAAEPEAKKKQTEAAREAVAEAAMREGFVLTHYFFEALKDFEKDPVGLQDAYPAFLRNIWVDSEKKRASEVTFASQATPELVRTAAPRTAAVLDRAEEQLSRGDARGAQLLAQKALEERLEDPARALFILARAATMSRDMQGARTYFERTLELAREPRLVAWAHIYLGRIFDLQENREAAVSHYRAALAAGDGTPDTTLAAERGLESPYAPPTPRP